MKIIVAGDTHGMPDWNRIVNRNTFDKLVFIGDYFDSFDISGERQLHNFLNILNLKRENMDKVILLIGNHDFHYMNMGEQYSGFQSGYQYQINSLLKENIKLLQMCYVHGNHLFIHAGVTKTWCTNNNIDLSNIEQSINDRFVYQPFSFRFTIGKKMSPYGDEICQSPIWVRPNSLFMDKIDGYTQVVGHTPQRKLDVSRDIILIDTIETSAEFLQIDNGICSAIKI